MKDNGNSSNPQKKPNKVQLAYNEILQKILTNEYPPGSSLSERDISESLNISRTPVKDALNRLAFEGYIELSPERGPIVTKIGLTDILELYETREALECASVKLAAERCTPALLEEMRQQIAQQQQIFDHKEFNNTAYEDGFHMCIARASFNRRLITYIEMVIRQCRRASIFQNQHYNQRVVRSIEQHKVIFEAIQAHDPEAAEAAMHTHLQDVISTTKELMCDYYFMYQ